MHRLADPSLRQRGFTLVEMLVVAPIVILAIGAFLTVIISMTGEVISSRASNTLTFNVQDALARIEEDTKLSAGFLATNSVPITAGSGQGYNNDATNFTNVGGTSGTNLILNMVATTGNPLSTSSQYIFLKDQPNACAAAQNNIPLTYNVVYFVRDNSLWRRVIMPAQYADTVNYACAAAWQQPSCNPTWLEGQGGTPFCRTNDVRLVDGVTASDFSVSYFTGSGETGANATASNAGASVTDRTAALNASTTVDVTINANQTAAGRDIAQSASVRTSRLDTNASAIASLTPVTIPTAPSVRGVNTTGARATFSWPNVQGATGYTFQYNINGGAWVTGFTNQNTRTFTASAPAHEDVINARVLAINSAGSSGYGLASVTTPLWEPLAMQNGWATYSSVYSSPAYTKTRAGIVVLKGLIKKGVTAAVTNGETAAILPPGYRPGGGRLLFGSTANSNVTARVDVDTSGNVIINNGNTGWTSLDTVSFAASGRYTMTTATPLNGWAQYGGTWAPAQYATDSEGRVILQGLLSVGTGSFANGTRLLDFPAAYYPPQYMQVLTQSSGFGYVGLDYRANTTTVVAKGTGTSYLSTTLMYYPTGATGWTNLTLESGWTWYGTVFSTPQYKKGTDNIVSLKGLLRAGTTTAGTSLTTLPVGFRPKERLLLTSVSVDAHTRVDIQPNGIVTAQGGTIGGWVSLDGINFIGEQ